MILYILGTITLCIMLCFMYIRIKYRFWALQPVFHYYDLYYWIVNVGIIRKELPEKNRYVNLKNITTSEIEKVDNDMLKRIVILIRLNYLRNNENRFSPKKDNILPYFAGHNSSSFLSYFMEPEILLDNKTGLTIEDNNIVGVITSRPLHVIINSTRKDASFDVYYVDYLCVGNRWRKRGIAPELIQSHEYNQSLKNRNICVSLFKREEELTGIIPLTVYKTYCFHMKNWIIPERIQGRITFLEGDSQNMHYLYNFMKETSKKWDITIYPEITNLIELVRTKNMFIIMLVIDGNIEGVYMFRKTCTFIETGKEIIACIGSIKGKNILETEFIKCFKSAVWSVVNKNRNFAYLTVEDISDNKCIIDNLCIKTEPILVSPSAYFFYNFAYTPFNSCKCLIIN